MGAKESSLTDRDHANMHAFLGRVLNAHANRTITQHDAVALLAHMIASVDGGDYAEVRMWFEEGQNAIRHRRAAG